MIIASATLFKSPRIKVMSAAFMAISGPDTAIPTFHCQPGLQTCEIVRAFFLVRCISLSTLQQLDTFRVSLSMNK